MQLKRGDAVFLMSVRRDWTGSHSCLIVAQRMRERESSNEMSVSTVMCRSVYCNLSFCFGEIQTGDSTF